MIRAVLTDDATLNEINELYEQNKHIIKDMEV